MHSWKKHAKFNVSNDHNRFIHKPLYCQCLLLLKDAADLTNSCFPRSKVVELIDVLQVQTSHDRIVWQWQQQTPVALFCRVHSPFGSLSNRLDCIVHCNQAESAVSMRALEIAILQRSSNPTKQRIAHRDCCQQRHRFLAPPPRPL